MGLILVSAWFNWSNIFENTKLYHTFAMFWPQSIFFRQIQHLETSLHKLGHLKNAHIIHPLLILWSYESCYLGRETSCHSYTLDQITMACLFLWFVRQLFIELWTCSPVVIVTLFTPSLFMLVGGHGRYSLGYESWSALGEYPSLVHPCSLVPRLLCTKWKIVQ